MPMKELSKSLNESIKPIIKASKAASKSLKPIQEELKSINTIKETMVKLRLSLIN